METTHHSNKMLLIFMVMISMFSIAFLFPKLPPLGEININEKTHAVEKHSSDAVLVRDCMNNNPNIKIFHNPITNRIARLCEIESGKYGIQIVEKKDGKIEEVTSFVKNKMSKLDQVIQYLNNAGYK